MVTVMEFLFIEENREIGLRHHVKFTGGLGVGDTPIYGLYVLVNAHKSNSLEKSIVLRSQHYILYQILNLLPSVYSTHGRPLPSRSTALHF